MTEATAANPIDEQAMRWAVRRAHGTLTPDDQAALARWLDADARHRGAYLRARAGLHALERAVLDPRRAAAPRRTGGRRAAPSRRWSARIAAGAGALAACVAGALLLVDADPSRPAARTPAAATVAAAAPRRQDLGDGSVAWVSPGGQIRVQMLADSRRITLLRGEARFVVAPDHRRPFVVQSGRAFAQATGTIYTVARAGAQGGAVSVQRGSVLVWAGDERDQAVLLHAGDRMTLEPHPAVASSPAPAPLPSPALAQFAFDDVPIATAVRRFNRVNRVRIRVDDPAIGAATVVGLFRANEPERFAAAAAAVAGGCVTHRADTIVIGPC